MIDTLRRGIPSRESVAQWVEHETRSLTVQPWRRWRGFKSRPTQYRIRAARRVSTANRVQDASAQLCESLTRCDSNSIASRLLRQHNGTDVLPSRSIPERSV